MTKVRDEQDKLTSKGVLVSGQRIEIGGDVDNSTVIVAGGDVNLFPKKLPVHTMVQKAIKMLRTDDYDRALEACMQVLADEPHHPEANLLVGIALLKGRSADRLQNQIVTRVEKHLSFAIDDPSIAPTTLAVLGIVKYDHYVVNGLFEGQPTLKQILQLLKQEGHHRINRELLQYVSGSTSAREYLGIVESE